MGVLLALIIPVGLNLLRTEQLDTATDEVLQILRRAQALALSQENDSSYGVFFTDSSYTLFKGDSFISREAEFDQVYKLAGNVTASGLDEVVFPKLYGLPDSSGIVSLKNSRGSSVIQINAAGRIASLISPFTTYASVVGTGDFVNAPNALGPPDDIFAEGTWAAGNNQKYTGYSDGSNTGTITRVEIFLNGYISIPLIDDDLRVAWSLPDIAGSVHTIAPEKLNLFVGQANRGNISIDITQDRAWAFADFNTITLGAMRLRVRGGVDGAAFFLDSAAFRITFE